MRSENGSDRQTCYQLHLLQTFAEQPATSAVLTAPRDAYRMCTADSAVQQQTLTIKADPRDPATADDLATRHTFLVQENADLSSVDTMLNAIGARLKRAPSTQRAALIAFKHRLTLDPRNIEDLGVVQLRERLLDLLGRVGSTSFQMPTAMQPAEGIVLHGQTLSLVQAYTEVR